LLVWNNTKEKRVVLLFDLWFVSFLLYIVIYCNLYLWVLLVLSRHPDLTDEEIQAIEEMFLEAKQKGWMKG
jgi:hypothetical protein